MPEPQTKPKLDNTQAAAILSDIQHKAQRFFNAMEAASSAVYRNGKTSQGTHIAVDLAIDYWNELINLAPGGLKRVKLDYLLREE